MTKEELRKIYLQRRQSLTEAGYMQLNHLLCDTFFTHFELSFIRVMHVFLPIEGKREPDTWLIIDRIRREFPHIRLSVPKVNTLTNALDHFYFEGLHQLEKSKWGVPEPKQGIPTPVEKIDLVLVPLLAFDTQGHRLGYGKGYYDRFLSLCRPDTKKTGVSFFPPEARLPAHDADARLNGCITPSGFVAFAEQ